MDLFNDYVGLVLIKTGDSFVEFVDCKNDPSIFYVMWPVYKCSDIMMDTFLLSIFGLNSKHH